MSRSTLSLWGIYAAFALSMIGLHWSPRLLSPAGPYGAGKYLVWAAWLGFLIYSLECSRHENLLTSIRQISRLYWGRQIGIDLYLGLGMFLLLIFLHQGPLTLLIWLLPTLVFGNLAPLLYFALYYDQLVAKLLTG